MGIGAVTDLLGGGGGGGGKTGVIPTVQRKIEIDGTELSEEVDRQVESVTVIDRLQMPDSFVLVLRDPGRSVLETAGATIGAKVKISTTPPGGEGPEPLFYGEVTSIEAEYDLLGMRAVVRGYDLMHRLAAGRKTKTFENVTYSDVASEIADGAGLDADVDDTSGTVDHVIQPNISDLEFLYQLAARVGYDVGVEEETLLFKEPTESSDSPGPGDAENASPTQLVWGHNLIEFRARMSAVAQVSEVKVRGWDPLNAEAVIGQADAETSTVKISMAPDELADAVGGEALVVVDRPVADQGAADDLAAAIARQVASSAYEATAVAIGSPELKAGQAVSVSKVDPALEGDWVITTARHEFGLGPYRTHLEFSGRQDRSLYGLVTNGGSNGGSRSSVPGVVVGIVTDNEDPEEMGRVKVQYPWMADDAESFWARVAFTGAGEKRGVVWIPEVGDEVVVAFEHGDIAYPVIVGSVWNGEKKPPTALLDGVFDGGKVKRNGIVSRLGHTLVFYDADDTSGIALYTSDKKIRIALNESKGSLHITTDQELTIEAKGDIKIKSGRSLKLEAGTTMDVKSSAALTIKGATVGIN